MPTSSTFHGFDRRILPYILLSILTGLFFILTLLDMPLPAYKDIRPFFLLIPIYYWTVFVPSVMPMIATFILCLLIDLLSGAPIGVSIITICSAQWILRETRQLITGQNFSIVWTGFAVFVVAIETLRWAFYSLSSWHLHPIIPPAFSAALLFSLYPLCTLAFIPIHRIVIRKPSVY